MRSSYVEDESDTPSGGGGVDQGSGRLGRWRHDLSILRVPSARRLIGADFASFTGDTMVWTVMAFAVLAVGGSEFQVGLALAAQATGLAAMLLFGGVLADRYPRRLVMIAADLFRFGSQGLIAALLLFGEASLWQLIAAQLVHGIGTGIYMPASGSIVPDAVGAGLEQPTNALKQVGRSVAGLGGPALGAGAVHLAGPGLAMAADAATFLASAALLSRLSVRRRGREAAEAGGTMLTELREGWSEFLALHWMRAVTIQFTLVNALVVAPFFVFGPTRAASSLGGVDAWAALLFAMAAGELVGGLAVVSWRPARPIVAATLAFLLWGFPLGLLAAEAPFLLLLAGGILAGIGSAVFAVLWETTVQLNTPDDQRGRLMAVDQFGSLVGVPLGFIIGGFIGDRIGVDRTLLGGLAFLIVAGLIVVSLPSVRQLRAAEPGQLGDDDGDPLADDPPPRRPRELIGGTVERLEDGDWVRVPAADAGP